LSASALIRKQDRERLLAELLAPVEYDDEDRELAQELLAQRSAEDIAAALVHAQRARMPQPEDMIPNTPEARGADRDKRKRPGFEDTVWYRLAVGRRQNADPRWILPLLCRRGHVTRDEIGAIRIAADETHVEIPRALQGKFDAALARTAQSEDPDDTVHIAPSDPPRHQARDNRREGSGTGGRGAPGRNYAKPAPRRHRKGQSNDGPPPRGGGSGGAKPFKKKFKPKPKRD
jgi:ATP-dependent RNA helicase DeaD